MAVTHVSPDEVAARAQALGRTLDPAQARGLSLYLGLLETWNRKMNLVGPGTWPEMLGELVADSWRLADLLGELVAADDPLTLDYGAGAGIPGVPLRLFWGAGRYVLIEPRAKRAGFLRQCLAMLSLPATEVFQGRAESLALPGARAVADVCLSRAFQPWREFLETVRPVFGPRSLAVVFANQPRPEADPPEGYAFRLSRDYPRRDRVGYFWVFEANMSVRAESLKMTRVAS